MARDISAAEHEGGLSLYLTVQNADDLCGLYGAGALSAAGFECARRINFLLGGVKGGIVEMLEAGALAVHGMEVEGTLELAGFTECVLLALCEEPIELEGENAIILVSAELRGGDGLVRPGIENLPPPNHAARSWDQLERDRLRLEMRRAVSFQGAISGGGLCSALQPVAGAHSAQALFYKCHIYIGGMDGSECLTPTEEFIPALGRLNLLRYIDIVSVSETIRRLRENPTLVLACTVSAASAVCDAWWHSVFMQLASDHQIARRLIFSIRDLAGVGDVAAAVKFTKTLKVYGCKIAAGYSGHSVGGMAFLVACRPDIVIIDVGLFDAGALNLASGEAGSQVDLAQAFDLARHLAPYVVLAGVETQRCWEVLCQMGAAWFLGSHIGVPALFARPGRTDCVLDETSFDVPGIDCNWSRMHDRIAFASGAIRVAGGAC